MTTKPFSPACENNRRPILDVVVPLFADRRAVLEVGSGTGQHAVYFGAEMPHLQWYTSDLVENHAGIIAWLDEADLPNVQAPTALDVSRKPWPQFDVDAVFSANTAHIMSWAMVEHFVAGVGDLLPARGVFVLYGPFNYAGKYTSESNARFDRWLAAQDPLSAIRDFEAMDGLAKSAGLSLLSDNAMPANNRLLCWRKTAT